MLTSTTLCLLGAAFIAPVLFVRSGFFPRGALYVFLAGALLSYALGAVFWASEAGLFRDVIVPPIAVRVVLLAVLVAGLVGGRVVARKASE